MTRALAGCGLPLAAIASMALVHSLIAAEPRFKLHTIGNPDGTNFGQTSAVDVDRDGDLDFISDTQHGRLY